MNQMKRNPVISTTRLLPVLVAVLAVLLTVNAYAAAPGISGAAGAPVFNLTAQADYMIQPDGATVYAWGYGCSSTAGLTYKPFDLTGQNCPTSQIPGPTLVVTEGDVVTVNLSNGLPTAAGNTSILFPGFKVATTGGVAGLLTQEAAPAGTVTYRFTASSPGTRAYYSGTQGDLQIEMGMYGAIIVMPKSVPASCSAGVAAQNTAARSAHGESDFRNAYAAYDSPLTCYDREYLFQFAEMDPRIHTQAEAQVAASAAACSTGASTPGCGLNVATEPYRPAYFLINGRSMPDDMDPNYAAQYPHQPYNGNPHMHPGEQVLLRIIGQGRWQHPFHEHANHVRILARDGNLILTPDAQALAGPPLFTTTTTPGVAMDGIFYFTGRGLNWDMYAHNPKSTDANAKLPCYPDANGYNTGLDNPSHLGVASAINYYEWCADHFKPLQAAPFGDVASGGPATLPDANILTNGAWYGGTPYLGPDATLRAGNAACATTTNANCSVQQPTNVQANPSNERGFAFMWHSHNEREITTNNVFPGGMLMMMLIDSREFLIDERN
jgi:FtsP/CotA-like multicopper oxidase with cupredoxin domain